MPLEITVTVCDRGSLSVHRKGDGRLARDHGPDVVALVEKALENAALEASGHEHIDDRLTG